MKMQCAGCAACGDPGPSRAADVDKLDVEMVEKLDRMMEGAMRHLHQRLADGQGRDAWLSLLLAFRQSILPTFRVKFTQYLIWYMCAKVLPCCPSLRRCALFCELQPWRG